LFRHSAQSFERALVIGEWSSSGSRCFVSSQETVRFFFPLVVPFYCRDGAIRFLNVSYSWEQTLQIAEQIKSIDTLGVARREQYSTLFLLAAASGLRIGELLALRKDDIGENTIRVDESVDRAGVIGPCKNVAAYKTVVLADSAGRTAMKALRHFAKHDGLVFHSKNNGTLAETTILTQGLHPAAKAVGLPKAGMHAFRRGCTRQWELARISCAVIRQQMGHATADMTALYTGEIPIEQVTRHFQLEPNRAVVTASSGS
jgi:integrase